MRNLLFVLALGIAAIVHFTHQLFPNLMALAPAHAPVERLDSTPPYAPRTGPATWLPEPTQGEDLHRPSACVDSAPMAAERLTASSQRLSPGCVGGPAIRQAVHRGL